MKRILLAALAILLTACLSPWGGAPQTAEPTPTVTTLPTATATVPPIPTSTQPPQTPDVSVMKDEEKIALVVGYETENKYLSTVFPNIVIIDDGTSYMAYDIQTGEVSSLEDAGLAALSLTEVGKTIARGGERGFIELECSVGGNDLLQLLLTEGINPGVESGTHQDAMYVYRELYQPSNFENLIFIPGGKIREIIFIGDYTVFAAEVQVSGRNAVMVFYVDGNGELKTRLVYDTTVEQIAMYHGVR